MYPPPHPWSALCDCACERGGRGSSGSWATAEVSEVDSSQARRVSTVRPRAWSTDSTSSMVRPGRRVRVTTSSSPDQSVPRMS